MVKLRTVPTIVIVHTYSEILEFPIVVLIDIGIFLRGSKLCGESRTKQVLLVSKKEIEGNHASFRDK